MRTASIISKEDRNRYRAMCSWRKKNKQEIPTEAEYKAYRNSADAGKHKSIGINKDKGTEENRSRYFNPPKKEKAKQKESESKGAKKSKKRRARIKSEEDASEELTFKIRASEVIARINAQAIALTRSRPQMEAWKI